MKIFIDSDFKCHTSNPDGVFREFETSNARGVDFFKNKCKTFIEGHLYIPGDEIWVRSDGEMFEGEMVTPWKPADELDAAQRKYEKQLLAEYETALAVSVPVSDLTAAYQEGVNAAYDQ